ncbi:2Fe-2S iron-sulfur cluster-binding protein [Flavisolibacter ginsenosidimutans]|uniref:2Fe-2S iron-sulfur cluster binding domain-containing protein n=1 Tax=Flavisolibacter ginsenosidimutans TaxID=661481 RepID=A0A5B8UFN9_9BACT|nr:2Fe-2S iron-sulfur cluster-binding protein [Flavisolibacter ginsenosidimutans]QEC54949.1 2Fe-2S iron-sulfur cluster binding domain-containing protein [Flavisolibacter ginsenosidimutans]
MYTIIVSFTDKKSPLQLKRIAAGQTLLEVLLNDDVNIRHDCGGVCHCTTCHIYIEKGGNFLEEPSKRETDFLKKVAQRKPESRLACQCLLLAGKGEITVRLPDGE